MAQRRKPYGNQAGPDGVLGGSFVRFWQLCRFRTNLANGCLAAIRRFRNLIEGREIAAKKFEVSHASGQ